MTLRPALQEVTRMRFLPDIDGALQGRLGAIAALRGALPEKGRPGISLIGFDAQEAGWLRARLGEAGWRSVSVVPAELPRTAGAAQGAIALVDVDAWTCVAEAVDHLLAFRKRHPQTRVVMVSARVARDDFTRARAAICDVTLRKPLSVPRLCQALEFLSATDLH